MTDRPSVPSLRSVGGSGDGNLEFQPTATPEWWFDARQTLDPPGLAQAVKESSCTAVLLDIGQSAAGPGKPVFRYVERPEDLPQVGPGEGVLATRIELAEQARAGGRRIGVHVQVKDLEGEFARCLELCGRGYDFLVVDIANATYIPYEQLLVRTHQTPTRVLRSIPIRDLEGKVTHALQSMNAFATMEHGIGVLFSSQTEAEVRALSSKIARRQPGTLPLTEVEVFRVTHCGLGHRSCVDTTSMMTPLEGMIVGSTGWGGLFVCSETHYLPHMNLREFRVNAGGIHSYIWGPGDTHYYLSEMQAGREVLVVDTQGHARVATVGRSKIERRPLVLVEARLALDKAPDDVRAIVEDHRRALASATPPNETLDRDGDFVFVNAFLQNDWHVRLMGADGKVRHSTLVQPGDKLLAHVERAGRHMGEAIDEYIVEK